MDSPSSSRLRSCLTANQPSSSTYISGSQTGAQKRAIASAPDGCGQKAATNPAPMSSEMSDVAICLTKKLNFWRRVGALSLVVFCIASVLPGAAGLWIQALALVSVIFAVARWVPAARRLFCSPVQKEN